MSDKVFYDQENKFYLTKNNMVIWKDVQISHIDKRLFFNNMFMSKQKKEENSHLCNHTPNTDKWRTDETQKTNTIWSRKKKNSWLFNIWESVQMNPNINSKTKIQEFQAEKNFSQ